MIPVPLIIAGIAAGTLIAQKLKSGTSKNLQKSIPQNVLSKLAEPLHANAKTTDGKHLIEHAIAINHIIMLNALIANGADVNGRSADGTPFLIKAVKSGHWSFVQSLLDAGASPNCMDAKGKTPLFYVSNSNDVILKILLQAGADPNAQDSEGNYAIFHILNEGITSKCFANRVNALSRVSADFTVRDLKNNTLLFFAQSVSPVSTHFRNIDINAQNSDGKTALFYIKNPELIKYLLQNRADVNIKDNTGKTAIFYSKSYDITTMLVKYGANLRIRDNSGKTVIFYHKSPVSLEYLLKKGAHINTVDNEGKTALFYTHDLALQRILVKYGINIYATDNEGKTAYLNPEALNKTITVDAQKELDNSLNYAVTHNKADLVNELLMQGANPNHKHQFVDDNNMLEIAIINQNIEIVSLLLTYNAECNAKILNDLIKEKNIAMIQCLLDAGVCGNTTSLMLANEYHLDDEIISKIRDSI